MTGVSAPRWANPVTRPIDGAAVLLGTATLSHTPALPTTRAERPARHPWWWNRRLIGALLAFLAYVALAVVLARWLEYHEPDAFSRTASAYRVIFGREQRLAALGAVWTPLPALVQMPFLVVLSPFGLQDLAGAVVGALATVATLAMLDHLARSLGLARWLRVGLLLLYGLNPMVALFAANGQGEALFLLLVVATVCQLLRWADDARPERVLTMGYVTATAFLVRYETIPFAMAVGAGMAARQLVRARGAWRPLVPTQLYFGVPILLAILWWLRFNWDVTGDPLFFFWGPYSNVAQTAAIRTPGHDLYPYYRDAPASLGFVLQRVGMLSPSAAILASLVILGAIVRRSWPAALATLALASIPLFAAYQLFGGQSSAQFRYTLVAAPAGVVLTCLAWHLAPARVRTGVGVLALVLAAAAIPLTVVGMADRKIGRMEWGIIAHVRGEQYGPRDFTRFRSERAAALDLDARSERTPVLVDTVTGFPALAFSQHPDQFVSTTDADFEAVLAAPYGRVEYLLVHDPRDATDPNPMSPYARILQVHPDLLEGADWAQLEREYGAWKLFRVVGAPPTQAPAAESAQTG